MNFCAAILILKVEEDIHFWHIMFYYSKKGKNASETQKEKICAVYREGTVTYQMSKVVCQVLRWKFLTGLFSSMVG